MTIVMAGCIGSDVQPPEPTASASATQSAPPAADIPCQDEFSAQIESGPEPTVPNVAYVVLTNEGDVDCALSGFPSDATYVDQSGPIETLSYSLDVADDYGRAGAVITVAPGDRAYVWAWVVQTASRSEACDFPVPTTGVSLTLPGASAPVVARAAMEVCLDQEKDDLRVGPVDSEPRPASSGW